MFIRIVKMEFQEDKVSEFLANFNAHKEKIRSFEGCHFLELYQSKTDPVVFFTYSYWESDDALAAYRDSDLFKSVWKKTKALFASKAQAWSVNRVESLP